MYKKLRKKIEEVYEMAGDRSRRIKNRRLREESLKARRRKRRSRRRNFWQRIFLTFLTIFILAVGGGKVWSFSEKERGLSVNEEDLVNLRRLHSDNAVLFDMESGEKLAALSAGKRIYPASLTKIMTALIVVEETEDLDGTMVLPSDFFSDLYAENASMAGFLPGESVNRRDLLYGILLPSGAECCLAFAEEIAGSEEAFAERMNAKAKELGMKNTHFCNATGLHNPEHWECR